MTGRAMDEISRKILTTIQDFLTRLTASSNLTSEQLTEAFMATTALGYQIARMDYPEQARDEVDAAEASLAKAIASDGPPPRERRWREQWSSEAGGMLCAAIENSAPIDNPDMLDRIRELLVSYHEKMDPVVSAGTRSTYSGGRGDKRDGDAEESVKELTADVLEDWLLRSGNAPAGSRVSEFRQLMGGYSKATYIAAVTGTDGTTSVVIRKDSPGLPTGSSVVGEFPVLGQMHEIGIPVPAPLWIEPDAGLCDGAFMGVAFVDGKPANQIIPEDPVARRKWARSAAEVLGQLHRDTAIENGDVREPVAREIDDLERRMLERERAPHPGLLIGIGWLRQHLDDLRNRPACRIHGDVGYHNMLMRDDRIAALLDWEFSRIGDPVEDLASIKPFMDQIEAWDEFYEIYQSICGFTLDTVADNYFNVWREVRNMVACIGSLNSLMLPGVRAVPLTVAGTIYIPKYEIAILDAINTAEGRNV